MKKEGTQEAASQHPKGRDTQQHDSLSAKEFVSAGKKHKVESLSIKFALVSEALRATTVKWRFECDYLLEECKHLKID